MLRVCAWCGKMMGEKPPYEDKSITHGICEECLKKLERKTPSSHTAAQFVKVGERIRYISSVRGRLSSWPEGAWLEYGIEGTVTEYHPEGPAVTVGGEYFEALPPWAVVKFDNRAISSISPEDEGERWERIESPRTAKQRAIELMTKRDVPGSSKERNIHGEGLR